MSTDTRSEYIDKTVQIKRCAAVVKGGRRFSFAALVVVGDGKGKVGWGYGKANEVPPSVEKATKDASRSMKPVPRADNTIPHRVRGNFGTSSVVGWFQARIGDVRNPAKFRPRPLNRRAELRGSRPSCPPAAR